MMRLVMNLDIILWIKAIAASNGLVYLPLVIDK